VTSPATYRCTACGQEFSATSAYVRHGLSHLIDPTGRSPRVCFRGRMEPVGEPGAEALAQARREARR